MHNTLDSYRYQIESQGFAFEEKIDDNLPPVVVDREAIARAVVNLVNNALKYSDDDKFLGVKLYRDNGSVKLEVVDHGIGIARRDQAKIFEKFYRTGDLAGAQHERQRPGLRWCDTSPKPTGRNRGGQHIPAKAAGLFYPCRQWKPSTKNHPDNVGKYNEEEFEIR